MKGSGKSKEKKIITKLMLAFSAALLTLLLTQFPYTRISIFDNLENNLIDQRFTERGERKIEAPRVVIVEISQESFNQIPPPYNSWPWPRSLFAKLIENLNKAGAKTIGIDIVMSQADKYSPVNDTLLLGAIRKYGNVVVAGKMNIQNEQIISNIIKNKTEFRSAKERALNIQYSQNFENYDYNFENIFSKADNSVGIVDMSVDNDGVIRRYLPYINLTFSDTAGALIPSFSFALLNKYFNKTHNFTSKDSLDYFVYNNIKIPKYDNRSLLLNYYSGNRSFPHYHFFEIIDDNTFKSQDEIYYEEELNEWYTYLEEGVFKDKIVLIGTTMPEDKDIFPTSFSSSGRSGGNLLNGVEIHATAIQNILDNNFFVRSTRWVEILVTFSLTLIVFYLCSFTQKIKFRLGIFIALGNLLLITLLIYLYYLGALKLFIDKNIVMTIVSPSFAILMGYLASTAYHIITERQQNVLIKGMFSQYVSKAVVNELISNPDKLRLGGEKKNLTVLFSDIAGFTTFAEKKKPEELVSFINEFLNEMTEIILANNGTLDKYLGDAVMAFWGAPIEVEDHAFKACITALQMQDKLTLLREKWVQSEESTIYIRIGINSGDVIVGNIGGEKRFDYTVLGDDVNLASRLEGANKEYGTNIMISDSTCQMIKDKFLVRELDAIRVKGKTEPTKVYELISQTGDKEGIEVIEKMDYYFQAIELYRSRNFQSAMDYFKRSFEKLGDYPSKVYMERCEFYLANPPSSDWDGAFEFKSK